MAARPSLCLEFERVLAVLSQSGVRYVVVGGVAGVLHGADRLTADLDVVVDLAPEACRTMMDALSTLGYRARAPSEANREQRANEKHMQVFSLWDPENALPTLDLFLRYPMDFNELVRNAMSVTLGDVEAKIASIDDLIAIKLKAGRPRDLEDVERLRDVQRA